MTFNYSKFSLYNLLLAKIYSFITICFLFVDFILLVSNQTNDKKLYNWLYFYVIGNCPFLFILILSSITSFCNRNDIQFRDLMFHIFSLLQVGFNIYFMTEIKFYSSIELSIYIYFTVIISFLFITILIILVIYIYFEKFGILDHQLNMIESEIIERV